MMSTGIGLSYLCKTIFPIATRKYWYASCYIFLLILSPWINQFLDDLEKKFFQELLVVCVVLFYLFPTFFYFEIMNDKGKGLVHMIICYMIGRYVARYCDIKKFRLGRIWFSLLGIIFLTFVGNMGATLVRGEISWPFSRECTITTLLVGILMCMIALHGTGNSRAINAIAKYTFHIYLLNNALIVFTRQYIVADSSSMLFMLEVIAETILICVLCGLIAIPLDKIARLFAKVFDKIANVFYLFLNWSMKYIEKHY